MPPKRKQNDDSALEASTSTRSTRTSTRSSTAKTTAKETAASKATNAKKTTGRGAAKSAVLNDEADDQKDDSESIESARPAKKARTSAPSRKKATNAAASRVQKLVVLHIALLTLSKFRFVLSSRHSCHTGQYATCCLWPSATCICASVGAS
ncbi:hypothetical protein CPC08DRAFT_215485 [Agrocybe pediades]|nr:hypothetical protein CPC08DRAFT_215485 [Agrocybe pediades]